MHGTKLVLLDGRTMLAKRFVGRTHTNTAQLLEGESRAVIEKVIEVFRIDPRAAFLQWADDPQAA